MKQLSTGEFFGLTNKTVRLDGITLTDTEYTHDWVDWHYHENAYFTFILEGNVIEGNKKEVYNCSPGSLLFHNWEDPHYNIKPEGYTRGFQIELDRTWFNDNGFNIDLLKGSIKIANIDIKLLMFNILKETKIDDATSKLSIQLLLLKTLSEMFQDSKSDAIRKPIWVDKIKDILHDEHHSKLTLEYLSDELSIHPVHLSRDFSKYFHCNVGEYIRKIKLERSLILLSDNQKSLTDIAYECGFSDQSHFIRCFKSINEISPKKFRDIISR